MIENRGGIMEEKVNKKNNKQSFMMGVMTLFIAQLVVKLMGLIYRLVITNIDGFGDTGNGLYGSGYQIYTLLLAIASIGVPGAISKLVSERLAVGKNREAHEIFKTAMILFAIIGACASLFLFLGAGTIANWMGNPSVKGVMIALSPAIFFVAVSAVIRGYFNGMYNMKATSNSQMFEQLFKSILTIVLVQLVAQISLSNSSWLADLLHITEENRTLAMAIAGNAASTFATMFSCAYLLIFYQRRKKEIWKNIRESKGEYKKEKRVKIMKRILAISIPISLASIISAINRNIDTFTVINGLKQALSTWSTSVEAITEEATRLYGILSGKVDMLVGTPAALNVAFSTALVPAVSAAMANGDTKTAKRRMNFSLRTTLLLALPCAIGMCVLANPILTLLFPNAPSVEAPLLLQISAFTIIFTLMNQTIGGALQGLGKVMTPAISLACGAGLKLILNLILISNPNIGIYGAAISSVAASALAMIINIVVLNKSIKLDLQMGQTIIKPLIATGIMGAIAYFTHYFLNPLYGNSIATVGAVILAVITYFVLLVVLNIFEREDYHMLPYGDKIYKFLSKIKLVKP